MTTKTIPYTSKDFAWVKMTPSQMDKMASAYIEHKKKVYKEIKSLLPENRTFLNTLYALEKCDDSFQSFFSKMHFLSEVSTKKEIRDHGNTVLQGLSQNLVDIEYDRDLYIALVEYYDVTIEIKRRGYEKRILNFLKKQFVIIDVWGLIYLQLNRND